MEFKAGDEVVVYRKWRSDESDVGWGSLAIGKELTLSRPTGKANTWLARSESGLGWTVPECVIVHAGSKIVEVPEFEGFEFDRFDKPMAGEFILMDLGKGDVVRPTAASIVEKCFIYKKVEQYRDAVWPDDLGKIAQFNNGPHESAEGEICGKCNAGWVDEDGDFWEYCQVAI